MMKNNKLELQPSICSHLFFFFFFKRTRKAGNTKSRSHEQYFGYTLFPKVSEPQTHTCLFPIWQEAQAKRGRELISEVKVL